MRMSRTLMVVVAAAFGLGLLHVRAPAQTSDVKLAPEIEISEWINGDGRTSLADYRGEVVLLEFWSSH